ncbi:MAG: RDD family protein [Vicinamibacterales bacterium]
MTASYSVSTAGEGTAAGLPVRVAARVLDAALLAAITVGLGQLIGFGFGWLLAGSVMVLGYFALLDVFWGATLGKLAFGLRVVDDAQAKPSMRQALVRESFTIVGAIPFAGPLLALGAWIWISMTMASSAGHRGKHDLLAGTRVIRI